MIRAIGSIRAIAVTVAGAALYGFTIGYAHSDLYAQRDLIKVPLLLWTTAAICGLGYLVSGIACIPTLRGKDAVRLSFSWFTDLSILLASLAPANFLIAWTLRRDADAALGEYPMFLCANLLFVAIAGSLALIRQSGRLLTHHGATRTRARVLVASWLFLALLVGGQSAFFMRPFFGIPASRGRTPPFFIGNEPDVRGATNFFEVVLQFVSDPALPAWFAPTRR